MKVEVTNTFTIEKFDADGFSVPNKYYTIKKGQKWTVHPDRDRIVGGEVKLTRDVKRGASWIEISNERFSSCFKAIDNERKRAKKV